jgi:hypothetical protein
MDDQKSPQPQPQADNYRLIARKLRKLALECHSPTARQEILDLAARYERRGDHFDPRAAIRATAIIEGGDAAATAYRVTLRDRETQTVVGYFNGAWTTDQRRPLPSLGVKRPKTTPPTCAIAVRATLSSFRSKRSLPPIST